MKLGGRAPEDEDVPVVLVDDDRTPPTITTAEVELGRPRRRLRELLLVVAAVAVVAGVGLVGGGDGAEDREAAATPTTERTSPRTPTDEYLRSSTTTRPRARPTTTTSSVERLSGQGPMLPGGQLTGTWLGIVDNSGGVTILDLDTGNRCRTVPSRDSSWMPWSGGVELPTMVVQTGNRGLHAVDRDCAATAIEASAANGWIAAITGTTFWLVDSYDQSSITEHELATGNATGRSLEVPAYAGVQAVGHGDALVLGVTGGLTYVDLATGERRDLGPGTPLGLRDRTLLLMSCPALACHVAALDLDSGERTIIDGLTDVVPWETASFSPDGRYARVATGDPNSMPVATVVDLDRHEVVRTVGISGSVFTRDGRWLIGIDNGRLAAASVTGDGEVFQLGFTSNVQNVALLKNP